MDKLILTVAEVQQMLGGCGREFALYCMEQSGCMLPRRGKGSKYLVRKEKFEEWLGGAKA